MSTCNETEIYVILIDIKLHLKKLIFNIFLDDSICCSSFPISKHFIAKFIACDSFADLLAKLH